MRQWLSGPEVSARTHGQGLHRCPARAPLPVGPVAALELPGARRWELWQLRGTWLLRGLFGYTVGQRDMNKILFGYQYKEADFADSDLGLDYAYDGLLAGFSFRF